MFEMGKTFWGVVSAAVEQSRRKANMVAQGDGKFDPRGRPQNPPKQKKQKQNLLKTFLALPFMNKKWRDTEDEQCRTNFWMKIQI